MTMQFMSKPKILLLIFVLGNKAIILLSENISDAGKECLGKMYDLRYIFCIRNSFV